MDDYISPSDDYGHADGASSQSSKWASMCVSAQTCHLPALKCFGPHNIEDCILVKKAVKRYCSNNLKNDYESEEINSQDSEHEDKKSDNQYSECDDEKETHAY